MAAREPPRGQLTGWSQAPHCPRGRGGPSQAGRFESKSQSSRPLSPRLMALASPGLLDLLARNDRGLAVRRPARFLSARWLSLGNGIAGRKCHIDGPIVLSLFRVLAHD